MPVTSLFLGACAAFFVLLLLAVLLALGLLVKKVDHMTEQIRKNTDNQVKEDTATATATSTPRPPDEAATTSVLRRRSQAALGKTALDDSGASSTSSEAPGPAKDAAKSHKKNNKIGSQASSSQEPPVMPTSPDPLATLAAPAATAKAQPRDQELMCPLCDGPMETRSAGRGGLYHACLTYPRCRGTRSFANPAKASPVAEIRKRQQKQEAAQRGVDVSPQSDRQ